jgi:maltose O-acetyltransferase
VWWHWLVNGIAASPAIDQRIRGRILRRAGIDAGKALVESGCFFFGADVHLGDYAWINHGCYFDARDRITIGSRCSIAMEVMFCTSTHEHGDESKRAGTYRTAPVSVGDGTWIGTRTVLLPGATIGAGCVVAAGSVVRNELEPNGLYAGNPAARIRDL